MVKEEAIGNRASERSRIELQCGKLAPIGAEGSFSSRSGPPALLSHCLVLEQAREVEDEAARMQLLRSQVTLRYPEARL
ncbi:hypothetical protein MA16_Dca005783 [Dendrobium catenatum]|uniref:Uncharacterized protein n=1 Tax=Dendrobium catenatum TaxID=906689 RepID=A0A2I0WX67_9ASPA|nr:hypothetical protein MA16_Dca005783 [Dendrobium catenatum]